MPNKEKSGDILIGQEADNARARANVMRSAVEMINDLPVDDQNSWLMLISSDKTMYINNSIKIPDMIYSMLNAVAHIAQTVDGPEDFERFLRAYHGGLKVMMVSINNKASELDEAELGGRGEGAVARVH